MIGSGANLPEKDHVVRYVPWSKLRRDEEDNVLGFLGVAFALKPDEDAPSYVWLEYFEGGHPKRVKDSVHIFRATMDVGKKSAFAIGNVEKIRAICKEGGFSVRIVYDPIEENPAHSEIRRFPRDEHALLEALASEAFADLVKNSDVD